MLLLLVASVILCFSTTAVGLEPLSSPEVAAEDMSTLKSVHMIFRHGNKQLDEEYEVRTGLLTDLGKNEMFSLGQYMRSRYPSFLKDDYDAEEIEIISSGANRVIQSANLFAYGLYRNYNLKAQWNPREPIPYEPVPVLSIPKPLDKYLQVSDDCPRRKRLMDEDERELFIEKFLAENQDIVQAYVENTGDETPILPKGQRTSKPIIMLFDKIFLNASLNQPIPEWSIPFLERESLTTARYEYFIASINSPEAQQLHSGNLAELIAQNMRSSLENARKFQVYGAHDFTLMGLMKALSLDDKSVHTIPPTGSVLFFELHQRKGDEEPYVKAFFRNDSNGHPWKRDLPGCPEPCHLTTLNATLQSLVPRTYSENCHMLQKSTPPNSISSYGNGFGQYSTTFVGFLLIVLVMLSAGTVAFGFVIVARNSWRKRSLYTVV